MKKYISIISLVAAIMLNSCATSYYYNLPPKQFNEIDYKFEVKKVQVRNIKVAYIDEGQGDKVLLLIHGLGTNAKSWIKNIPALSDKYRVIAVDLPGYGMSDKGYYKYSMSFYAEFLTDMLTVLNIDKATFVGHSMGGQISLVTALEYPERVENLVLISPAGFEKFTEGEGDWMKAAFTIELVKETTTRSIDVNLKSNFYETPDDASFFVTDRIQIKGADGFEDYCYAVTRNVAGMIDEPLMGRHSEIKQNALILFGENDGLIPNAYLHGGYTKDIAEFAADALPNAELILVPECGHMLQFEKADVANKAIIDFLSN